MVSDCGAYSYGLYEEMRYQLLGNSTDYDEDGTALKWLELYCEICFDFAKEFESYYLTKHDMPPNHQKYVQWNGDRFIKWAAKIGSSAKMVVTAILNGYKVEQQGYKACMGILKLADKYTPERLENACKKALTFTPRPSYKNIQVILSTGQDKTKKSQQTEASSSDAYGFTRGADYYGGED